MYSYVLFLRQSGINTRMNKVLIFTVCTFFFGCSGNKANQPAERGNPDNVVSAYERDTIVYRIHNFQEAADLIDSLNYTPEAWQSGIREVPRLNWVKVPERWRTSTSKEIEVKVKKQVFFRVLAPLALEANEHIEAERERLLNLSGQSSDSWDKEDMEWFDQLAEKYKVQADNRQLAMQELQVRVDIIPLSLGLAQSAEESGWGTSRFAAEGNALFGQWAWGKDAMKPKEQREGMGDYGLRKFDTPLASMEAYMLNLNSHNAYKELRERRAQLRSSGQPVTGEELAKTLTRYSERGEEYVNTLQSLMRVNHLALADEAYLSDGPVILVMPVEN